MNITILDGYGANPGDLSWAPLEALGRCTVFDRSSRAQLPERLAHTNIAVSNKAVWDAELFDAAPHLTMIALTSTGYNVVDLEEANKRGIVVSNVPAYSTPDVAQHTFALLLELVNSVGVHAQSVRDGQWVQARDFTYSLTPLVELDRKTFGVIGMGSIGQRVARIAQAFGMQVIFFNRSPKPELESSSCTQVSLEDLFAQSDVVSLHCPATADTENIINAKNLARMKSSAYLINTARGNLVDEEALAHALHEGRIAGFGGDVVRVEPMLKDNPLREAPHAIITPHIAWAAREARERLIGIVASNIKSFLEGNPQNVVNNPR